MKKMKSILGGGALALLVAAGSASATVLPVPPTGYSWVNAAFWSPTDSTTPPSTGNSNFQLQFEGFGTNKDASFGLFTVSDMHSPSNPQRLEVFSRADTAGFNTKTVSFREEAGKFQVSLDTHSWTDFGKVFGFYFDYVNTKNDKQNGTYYSYLGLDSQKDDILNVLTASNINSEVLIYFDHAGLADQSYEMRVGGNDLAPVPEPGTMMLLGAGFLGLAVYGKRRKNA